MDQDKTGQVDKVVEGEKTSSSYSRTTAVVVLIAAIPMLILSSLALALFYASPIRFENFLSRLPGEAAIRTVLIFAPVTLLAIIVLSILYALEKPVVEITRPQVVQPPIQKRRTLTWLAKKNIQSITWWILLLSSALLIFLVPVRAAAFLSPTRFEHFLERFPGENHLGFIVQSGPIILLVIGLIAVGIFVGARAWPGGGEGESIMPGMRWLKKVGPSRLSVGIVLTFSLPILFLSLTSFILFFARTESFLRLIDHLPGEVPLRLGLIFTPASSIIVVALAILFLIRGRFGEEMFSGSALASGTDKNLKWNIYFWYLSWILAWAITLSGAAIIGSVFGVVVLLLK